MRKSIFFGFRTAMRLIRPEIRGDTISWGADLRKSSFSHLLNGPSIFSLCLFFPAPEHRIGSPALRPVVYSATPVAGMTDRKPGYFLSNISESYTIWLTKRVRKSIFLQKRTLRSGRDILIKFFCQNRTLETVFCMRKQTKRAIPHLFLSQPGGIPSAVLRRTGRSFCNVRRMRTERPVFFRLFFCDTHVIHPFCVFCLRSREIR